MKRNQFYVLFLMLALGSSCSSKPKVIEESLEKGTELGPENSSGIIPADAHEIMVQEIMHTKKYTYVSGTEGGEPVCVAIPLNEDIKAGKTYYYLGGLKMNTFEKMNFKQEHHTVILVGGLSAVPITDENSAFNNIPQQPAASDQSVQPELIGRAPGGISLAELAMNLQKYAGQTVAIKGQCVKINRNIMGRNWIHLQDGSKDKHGVYLDLTVTTQEIAQVNELITVEGIIALNKDFGAGYTYEYIMEEAVIKH